MTETRETECFVFLAFYGFEERPDEISSRLELEPTKSWERGDPIRESRPAVRAQSGWELESGLDRGRSFEEHLEALLERIEPRSSQIRELMGEVEGGVRVAFYTHDWNPGFAVSAAATARLAALGLGFDLDLYCWGED